MGHKPLLLFLLLSTTSLPTLVYTSRCPDIPGCGSCRTMSDGYFEYQCPQPGDNPTFTFQYLPNQILYVECTDQNAQLDSFPVADLSEVSNIPKFTIYGCYIPPDFSLADFSKRLGMQNVTTVFLKSVRFDGTLKAKNFDGFSEVQRLSLPSLNLTYLDENLLQGMPKLQVLNLRDNHVNISQLFFKKVQNLTTIELAQNHIKHIPPWTFAYLPNLKLLNIWQNELTRIDDTTLYNLESLKSLDLTNNPLEEISPAAFSTLLSLDTIHMNGVRLEALPRNLFRNNTKLVNVRIYNNQVNVTDMPDELFSNLPELEIVVLYKFGLVHLPRNTFRGSNNLKEINLSKNYMKSLPQDLFKGLTKLSKLTVQFNQIQVIPDDLLKNLPSLEYLDLSGNQIGIINSFHFVDLTSLKSLQMARNEIHLVEPEAFASLQNLEDVNLSHNKLHFKNQFDHSPLHYCSKLKYLRLSYNNISVIFSDWTIGMTQLNLLDLRNNVITKLDMSDVQFLSSNLIVRLENNKIESILLNAALLTIKAESMTSPNNVKLNISNNPVACDCRHYDFKRFIEGRLSSTTKNLFTFEMQPLNCAKPESMKGKDLRYIRSEDLVCEITNTDKETFCPNTCGCTFSPEKKSLLVDCSYKNLSIPPFELYTYRSIASIHLNITGNHLLALPEADQKNYNLVTELYASHNQITRLDSVHILPSLQVLEVDYNNLTTMSLETIYAISNSSIKRLKLSDNPWSCTCDSRDFLTFIQSNYFLVPNQSSVICPISGKAFIDMTINDLCETTEFIIIICVLFTLVAVILAMIFALYYRYQNEIKIWLYAHQCCLGLITEDDLDKDKPYDAFISYSHKDEHFVVNELVRKLESGPQPYKLCLHYRDWMAGDLIPSQIARSVEDSKRTIIVLSRNFLTSVWGAMEFRAAHRQALVEGRARVIVVIYGEVPADNELDAELKAYLNMNTYVQWGDKWFWDKLRYAMPHGPRVKKSKPKNNNDPNSLLKMNMNVYQGAGQSMLNMPSVSIVPNKLNEKTDTGKINDTITFPSKELLINSSMAEKMLTGILKPDGIKVNDKTNDTINEDDGFNNTQTGYGNVVFSFDDSHSTTV